MRSVRSTKSTYVAAFVFGALIALLISAPARPAETFRLDRNDPSHRELQALPGNVPEFSGALQ